MNHQSSSDSDSGMFSFPWSTRTSADEKKRSGPMEHIATGEVHPKTKARVFPGDDYFAIEKNEEKGRVAKAKSREEGGGWFSTGTQLGRYRLLDPADPDFKIVNDMIFGTGGNKFTQESADNEKQTVEREETMNQPLAAKFASPQEDRAVSCFVSMAIGDALGAPMEFSPVNYDDHNPKITGMVTSGHFGLKGGQWTDDASMGACIADSLLWCGGFDAYDMKNRFICWWNFGYNNAFRKCAQAKHSVGLGGNISMSFSEFDKYGTVYTRVGDENTSGNGSLMRNGALACYYHDDLTTALDVARKQSYTTHQGTEAAECCALLTFVCHKAINAPQGASVKDILDDLSGFHSESEGVACMARSEREPCGSADRDWNWKNPQHRYSPTRARQQPGYVGSYAMDNLAMALHCVYSTSSYPAALLKAANRCGDADSVCDVTGQIAGAIYGFNAIPAEWLAALNKWDDNDFAVRGVKMFRKLPARYPVGDEAAPNAITSPDDTLPEKQKKVEKE